jgi:SPX domain protein involved in polyphosphate accumulation
LYDEINRASERSASKQVDILGASSVSSSNPFAAHFLDLFEAEFTRVTNYISSQKESQEFSAKALMTNAEVLLTNKDASKGSAVDASKALSFKVSDQIDSCIMFERFVKRNAEILTTIASYADSKLNTFCTMMLQRKLLASPWKDGPSSSLFSDIYETIRAIEAEDKKKDAKWEAPSSFERATSKYWVQEERLTELLVTAVQEVPLLVYGKKGNLTSKTELLSRRSDGDKLWDELATSISSVYFDSPSMDLYKERIARSEGAQLLRARWYGSRPSGDEPVYLELKTHHEKWINTKSVKERVTIREKDMM